MRTLKTYEKFNYELKTDYHKQRYSPILNKIMDAKIGDVLPNETIYLYVEYLTNMADKYDECFVDGDLGYRLDQHDTYKLVELDINKIDTEEWYSDDVVVLDYKDIYKEYGEYPPIVVSDDYSIIDGTHRAKSLKQSGVKRILAFVGQ
jgi:hypothetical protein